MKQTRAARFHGVVYLLLATGSSDLSAADRADYELTSRLNIVGSSGKPTNDILGFGFTLHRRLNDDWHVGFNLDYSPEFDFERPAEIVDIKSDLEIDAVGTMLMITVVGERRYALEDDDWTGFWNLGAGFAEIDMDDADGAIRGGGTYDIETDIDTEFILIGNVGFIQRVGKHWSARYTLSAEHHGGGWDVRDRVSRTTGEIDDYAVYGVRVGMTYRF